MACADGLSLHLTLVFQPRLSEKALALWSQLSGRLERNLVVELLLI